MLKQKNYLLTMRYWVILPKRHSSAYLILPHFQQKC